MPLYDGNTVDGVVVAQRSLTEVATTVRLVRNALLTPRASASRSRSGSASRSPARSRAA